MFSSTLLHITTQPIHMMNRVERATQYVISGMDVSFKKTLSDQIVSTSFECKFLKLFFGLIVLTSFQSYIFNLFR